MKTLIINGSPRKNGDSMTLVQQMIKHLDGKVEIVHAYYDNIRACADCRYCWKNDGCAVNDKMQDIYKLLDEADNVIMASPLYFSELTGELLSFASRLQCFYARRCIRKDTSFKLKRKNAVLIITGGGDGGPEPAIDRAKIIFRLMNAELIGSVYSLHTDKIPAKEDGEAMEKARELAIKLNSLYKHE